MLLIAKNSDLSRILYWDKPKNKFFLLEKKGGYVLKPVKEEEAKKLFRLLEVQKYTYSFVFDPAASKALVEFNNKKRFEESKEEREKERRRAELGPYYYILDPTLD